MKSNVDLVKDVYQMSAGFQLLAREKEGIYYTDNEAIFESIRTLLSEGMLYQKRNILGENPFIDYNIFSKKFTYYDIREDLEVFDEAIPERKSQKLSEKISLLEEMAIDYHEDLEILFVAARLRRKYFSGDDVEDMMSFYRNELM